MTIDLEGQTVSGGNMDVYPDPEIMRFDEYPICQVVSNLRQLKILEIKVSTSMRPVCFGIIATLKLLYIRISVNKGAP